MKRRIVVEVDDQDEINMAGDADEQIGKIKHLFRFRLEGALIGLKESLLAEVTRGGS